MLLEEIIKPDSVLCNAQAHSKKHCLEILSELLVRHVPQIASEDVVSRLIERERLGCTSLGQGVAFPHCRAPGLNTTIGALIKLSEPVDFDAHDGEPVDVVFGLVVPMDIDATHQTVVAKMAKLLANPDVRQRIRAAETSMQLYSSLIDGEAQAVVSEPLSAESS